MQSRSVTGRAGRGRPPRWGSASSVAFAVALAAILGSLLPLGCKTSASGVRPATSYTAPEWSGLNIRTLAFLGVGSSVGDPAVRREAQVLIEEQLKGGQERFVVLGFQEAQRRAESAGAKEAFDKVVRVWRDDRLADPFLVKEVSQAVGVDGLLVASLLQWEQDRVDWASEGTSSTTVAIGLSVLSAASGTVVWEAEKTHRKETLKYAYGQSGTGIYTDPSGASRAERPSSLTPDPPRREDVAREAMQALMAAFPPRAGGSGQRSSGGDPR